MSFEDMDLLFLDDDRVGGNIKLMASEDASLLIPKGETDLIGVDARLTSAEAPLILPLAVSNDETDLKVASSCS